MDLAPVAIPQVLHIGFSKCGSSYLRAVFRSHARVNLVWKSGFFTPELYTPNPRRPKSLSEYRQMFDVQKGLLNVESDEHLTMSSVHPRLGVRGTNMEDFKRLVDRIAELVPGVKIIMVIRNQPSLLVSRYSEYVIAGGTRMFDEFAAELMGWNGDGNRYFQNYYASMMDVLSNRFPADQLLLLAQEQMSSQVGGSEEKIANFLGLHEALVPARGFLAERKSLSVAGMTALRGLNRILVREPSFAGAPPTTRCPWFLYHNSVRGLRLVDHVLLSRFADGPSSLLAAEHTKPILAHFEKDNRRLARFLSFDLVAGGYCV